jgi:hypothetical protein
MPFHRAYYSIIQYCPDRGRSEAANIGVILLCPDLGFAEAKVSEANRRVSRFFGRTSFDSERLNLIKHSFALRIKEKEDWSEGIAALDRFIGTRANDIQLTPARTMNTDNPAVDLVRLFGELVETWGEAKRERAPASFRLLRRSLHESRFHNIIQFNRIVPVPVVGKQLKISYAFQNGALNLVQPHQFKGSPERVVRDASELAVEGNLIQRHSAENTETKFIVVPAFTPDTWEAADRVAALFGNFDVQVIAESAIASFVEHIAATSHRS